MTKLDKNLFIRADAGTKIGIGHMMRCLALAERLEKKFDKIVVISNQLPRSLSTAIKNKGYSVHHICGYTHEEQKIQLEHKKAIKNDVKQCSKIIKMYRGTSNWLLVDHYGIDHKWEDIIRNNVEKIIVIDDLANRKHNCDVLIDQNLYRNMRKRYQKLVPKKCLQLLGTKFALLRPEFKNARKKLKRKYELRRILISFGGSDPSNETAKVLRGLKEHNLKYKIDVLIGVSNPHRKSIKRLCDNNPLCTLHDHTESIANLIANADLAIGGGGSMTWERCCLGLPTIVSILSDDQQQLTEEVVKIGCVINLGRASRLTSNDYVNAVDRMKIKLLKKMSKKCLHIVDGNGAECVANEISDN